MLEIINFIKTKYDINDIYHMYTNDNLQFIEFNLNDFASITIYKIDEDYNLLLSIKNSNSFPTKNININLFISTIIDFLINFNIRGKLKE